ncbi:hypothetical protein CR513_15680, partial [Mucuna pruriens]
MPQIVVIEQIETPFLKPLTIYYDLIQMPESPLTINVPAQPTYHENHAVPWRYDPVTVAASEVPGKRVPSKRSPTSPKPGVSLRAVAFMPQRSYEGERLSPLRQRIHRLGTLRLRDQEGNEYQLLDQMNKTPARISLLSLLLNSETQDITVERFGSLVNNITSRGHLAFSDDEVPAKGKGHNRPLHILVKCGGMIARVLIDNGSSLNVLPKATLEKLTSTDARLSASSVVVRAFDGSKREVMGEIILPILIGPTTFNITFQVMDIHPAYSCLLGRPWIHAAGVVPSSLH